MNQILVSICAGLGDNIIARMIFDTVKNQYHQIRISHNQEVVKAWKENDLDHLSFLKDIGNLLFNDPPFYFDTTQYAPIQTFDTIKRFSPIIKPNLQHLLCKGTPLNINEEYICITTKARMVPKNIFLPASIKLWNILNKLSSKYKIVIMGERKIEEFLIYKKTLPAHTTYSIYDQIIANIPASRIIDLTVPSLGIVAPQLIKVQQDGLILQGAKFAICLGNGGNMWHAVATANKVIIYKDASDQDPGGDALFNSNFSHVKMSKKWEEFIKMLEMEQ